MVASLDGYIAKKDNSVDWFETSDHYEHGIVEEDPETFLRTIECFVMGSRTYELACELGWPYGDVPTVVTTRRSLPVERETVEFYAGDLIALANNNLKPKYNNIWLVGGAILTKEFLRLKLADDIRLSILPIILGDGLPLFDHIGLEQSLHLRDVQAYNNGIVELWYEIRKPNQH